MLEPISVERWVGDLFDWRVFYPYVLLEAPGLFADHIADIAWVSTQVESGARSCRLGSHSRVLTIAV